MHLKFCVSLLILSFGATEALAAGHATTGSPTVAPAPISNPALAANRDQARRVRCKDFRSEYSAKAWEFLEVPPNTNLRDQNERIKLTRKYCDLNATAPVNAGACEKTLNHIVNTMINADEHVVQACMLVEKNSDLRAAGCDQVTCKKAIADNVRLAASKYEEAQKLIEGGSKELEELKEGNRTAATKLGRHLEVVAQVVESYNREQEQARALMSPPPPGAAPQFAQLTARQQNELINAELARRLGPEVARVEGTVGIAAAMRSHGLSLSRPEEIRERGQQIQQLAASSQSDISGPSYSSFGRYAGEQFGMVDKAKDAETLFRQAQADLGERATRMNTLATTLDAQIASGGSIQNPGAEPTRPISAGYPAAPSVAASPAPSRVASAGRVTSGSSSAMSLASLGEGAMAVHALSQNPAPKAAAKSSAAAAPASYRPEISASPSALSARNDKKKSSHKDLGEDESTKTANVSADADALPSEDLGKLNKAQDFAYSNVVNASNPDSQENVEAGGPYPDMAKAARSQPGESVGAGTSDSQQVPATSVSIVSASSREDPAMNAYLDRQIDKLQSGGRKFSPSLRAQLREKLKEGYSLRKLAAEGALQKGQKTGGSGGAVAGLIQQMRESGTLPGEDALTRRELLSLSGAETEAEIRRMLGELPQENDTSFGILGSHSQSLFERVRSTNQRHMFSKTAGR